MFLKNERPESSTGGTIRFAEYEFHVKKSGSYRLWIASTPLVTGWASTYSIRWNDQAEKIDMSGRKYQGVPYGKGKNEQFFFLA